MRFVFLKKLLIMFSRSLLLCNMTDYLKFILFFPIFNVVYLKIKKIFQIINEWFGRSVIRSRCRLTYDEAWSIIQTTQSNPTIEDKSRLLEFLPKPEAPFTFQDLQNCLSSLHLVISPFSN